MHSDGIHVWVNNKFLEISHFSQFPQLWIFEHDFRMRGSTEHHLSNTFDWKNDRLSQLITLPCFMQACSDNQFWCVLEYSYFSSQIELFWCCCCVLCTKTLEILYNIQPCKVWPPTKVLQEIWAMHGTVLRSPQSSELNGYLFKHLSCYIQHMKAENGLKRLLTISVSRHIEYSGN